PFSYSPVYDDTSRIAGMLCVVTEVTEKVVGERRLRVLKDLAARSVGVPSVEEACRAACEVLGQYPFSMPFAAIYRLGQAPGTARRVAFTRGLSDEVMPPALEQSLTTWPLRQLLVSETPQYIQDLPALGIRVPAAPWSELVRQALVLPLRGGGGERMTGFMVAGMSPRRRLPDERYRSFFDLVAGQVAAAVADAQASEAERRRAAALAEIDRAKTAFFSNVSHEFRTPLTLMLGPIEDAAANPSTPPAVRAQLELAHRNSLRLLKLVNSLLDFSRIEAGRAQACYEPTDVGVLTRDLASCFRSAMDRAGLQYIVECDDLEQPLYVDREMWEKIVLNLLSNAFKYTLCGKVVVRLSRQAGQAMLEVIDTGVGIPAREVPRLFERFHRVEGIQGRTQEGSGIGLALVQELVKLHGGAITATSEPGRGTTFRVTLPFGTAHLPAERLKASRAASPAAIGAQVFVQEALRWISPHQENTAPSLQGHSHAADARFVQTAGARLLVADDNADMRQYIRNLLSPSYTVESVSDGELALQAARRERPDLILSDIMMPRLDGLALLQALRGDEGLRDVPVILLSARAGEEARVQGMQAGADDYLVKPFSARELQVRVGALLELTRMRRENEERFRAFVSATCEVIYRMSSDWSEMRQLEGRNFIPDTTDPNRSWLEKYIHPDDQPRVMATIQAAVRTKSVFQLEHRVRRVDGTLGWTLSRAVPLLNDQGDVIEWFGAASNITERKETERLLREREEQLRLATEAAEVGMWDLDMLTDTLYWPSRVKVMFGIFTDVPVSMADFYTGLHPADRERISEAFAACVDPASRALYDVEYRTVGKQDRVIRWVAAKGRGIFDSNGTCLRVIGTAIDITARKTAEERLREETRVRELLGHVSQALVGAQLDLERVVQIVTDVATEMAGAAFGAFFYNVQDQRGDSYRLYTLSGAPREAFARFPQPRSTAVFGPTFRGEGIVRSADITNDPRYGRNPPHHGMPEGHLLVRSFMSVPVKVASGQVLGGLFFGHPEPGVFNDRTEQLVVALAAQAAVAVDSARLHQASQREIEHRKQAEAAQSAARAELRQTLDTAGVGLTRCSRDLIYRAVNPAYARLVGLTVDQIIGRSMLEVVGEEDFQSIRPCIERVLAGERVEDEIRLRYAGGPYHWVSIIYTPDLDLEGSVVGWVGSVMDITERKQAEAGLREADRRKDEFLAMLAHELRNPLAPIGNASEYLAQLLSGDARAQSAVEMIKRQATQLTRLVDDLLDVSRITQGRIQLSRRPVELGEILTQAVETVETLLRAKLHRVSIT
ncbi:MAG: PAS domain-containing protein, partial [Steroidobacteraceae bacterium]